MRWILRMIGRLILILVLAGVLVYVFGPTEDTTLDTDFDPSTLGADLDAYFGGAEAAVSDITPGVEKRVVWAGDANTKTDLAILYVHGFSATSQEIHPVPDRVADALGANLIYTRLQGHGRTSPDAMADGTVTGWMRDLAEGLAAARQAGDEVIVMSTSTGGTLVTAALDVSGMLESVTGTIFVSPNYGLNTGLEPLLTAPAARYWLPLLAGDRRSFEPKNEEHGTYWTTEYPSVAVLPMAAIVKKVREMDVSGTAIPALFAYSPDDQVVRPDITQRLMGDWGAATTHFDPGPMGPNDDPQAHVIAGDIMSPGKTDATVEAMVTWINGL